MSALLLLLGLLANSGPALDPARLVATDPGPRVHSVAVHRVGVSFRHRAHRVVRVVELAAGERAARRQQTPSFRHR